MAVDNELANEVRQGLLDSATVSSNGFELLQNLCRLVSEDANDPTVQELILLALENRQSLDEMSPILNALVRQVGLFPYLDSDDLSLADQIAYEFHRPSNMDDGIVFHNPQAEVYRALLEGENIALSAPTSFGKSLIIDAIISTGRFRNVVVVVPTIALIDETRRRLSQRFRGQFKIITLRWTLKNGQVAKREFGS